MPRMSPQNVLPSTAQNRRQLVVQNSRHIYGVLFCLIIVVFYYVFLLPDAQMRNSLLMTAHVAEALNITNSAQSTYEYIHYYHEIGTLSSIVADSELPQKHKITEGLTSLRKELQTTNVNIFRFQRDLGEIGRLLNTSLTKIVHVGNTRYSWLSMVRYTGSSLNGMNERAPILQHELQHQKRTVQALDYTLRQNEAAVRIHKKAGWVSRLPYSLGLLTIPIPASVNEDLETPVLRGLFDFLERSRDYLESVEASLRHAEVEFGDGSNYADSLAPLRSNWMRTTKRESRFVLEQLQHGFPDPSGPPLTVTISVYPTPTPSS
ncbi:hypothetical protein F4778DRAFT_737751 [Xylariomycetidae sp. FL2044]|nr:hypothetical protein F4778DRAFT_737751 [Xylariomycetidae sp. FL2044]